MFQRGARPIIDNEVSNHYNSHICKPVSIGEYSDAWRQWLTTSTLKSLSGLDQFKFADFVNGTSQTFDHFVLTNHSKQIVVLPGEFQYHSCITKGHQFNTLHNYDEDLQHGQALIVSLPFSDLGYTHPKLYQLLDKCNDLLIPVCLDLAYWGISSNVNINLTQYPCITHLTSSLSKPFYTLENHRVGIRFTRLYVDDGISMLNEVGMQNLYSMSVGVHYMKKFSCDWQWSKYLLKYQQVCQDHDLNPTDTIIFALGNSERHSNYYRGLPGNYRVCISNELIHEKS